MSGIFGSDAPTPPNPIATAGAQTGTNVNTAVANAFLNNVNQVTPTGELHYDADPTRTYQFTDPTTGTVYNIPRFTATQYLSGPEQDIQANQEAAKYNLSTLARNQSSRVSDLLSSPNDTTRVPPGGDTGMITGVPYAQGDFGGPSEGETQTDYGDAGTPQSTYGGLGNYLFGFGDAGSIARDYGPNDFSADRSRVEQSLFERLQPQLDRQRTQLEQRLADQGIRYGSPAYSAAMDDFNRQLTDTRLAITAQGGQEQKLQADLAAQRAGFANAAQQQAYLQAQGRGAFANTAQQAAAAEAQQRGTFANQAQQSLAEQLQSRAAFANTARQQQFQQAAARGTFFNQAQAQNLAKNQAWYNAANQLRAQALQEQFALRNQPINEITALLSGSQVQAPNFNQIPLTPSQIPTTDIASLINQNFSQQFQNYQVQQQAQNQLLGGILGAAGSVGAGLAFASDRRLKEDVHRIGTVFAAEPQPVEEPTRKKLPIYEYSYKDDPGSTRHVGPMAQDMEKVDAGAVGKDKRGMRYINVGRMMGSILRAA